MLETELLNASAISVRPKSPRHRMKRSCDFDDAFWEAKRGVSVAGPPFNKPLIEFNTRIYGSHSNFVLCHMDCLVYDVAIVLYNFKVHVAVALVKHQSELIFCIRRYLLNQLSR